MEVWQVLFASWASVLVNGGVVIVPTALTTWAYRRCENGDVRRDLLMNALGLILSGASVAAPMSAGLVIYVANQRGYDSFSFREVAVGCVFIGVSGLVSLWTVMSLSTEYGTALNVDLKKEVGLTPFVVGSFWLFAVGLAAVVTGVLFVEVATG